DSGSAARFFYCPKADKDDRESGIAVRPVVDRQRLNSHPTVKPTDLMRYLCRLITPPGGTVLDPFAGSGSTGRGALLEGFGFVGVEREAEYVEIARLRIAEAAGLFSQESA
ncbi:MAG: site-specific DNA-methyltransferase, partial [Phycisphaerales bacterium]|nr:site-specific DNA-methyltransferase [Phycisphaerales bacterium]